MINDSNDDDFYMILPSNACKDTHPDNEANLFTISWEKPVMLDEASGWKVALTEANFSYTMTSINTSFGIEYNQLKTFSKTYKTKLIGDNSKRELNITSDELPDLNSPPPELGLTSFTLPKARYSDDVKSYRVLIESDCAPFHLQVMHEPSPLWYVSNTNSPPYSLTIDAEVLVSHSDDVKLATFSVDMNIKYISLPYTVRESLYADKDVFWPTNEDMIFGLLTMFGQVFQKISMHEDGRLQINVQNGVSDLVFLNGLNIVLGFQRRKYHFDEHTDMSPTNLKKPMIAEAEPYLRHGINNIYVYSSICQPIRVGEVCVPLLKSIWLDTDNLQHKNVFGEMRNVVVKNPMYIPVSSTSINTIEVNLRSDSGHLLPFVFGSVTSLTLHFKRTR